MQKKTHIGYIDMGFLQYVYLYADQEYSSMQNISHIGCTDMVSLMYKTLYDLFLWRHYYNGSIDVLAQINVLIYWSQSLLFKKDFSQWLHLYGFSQYKSLYDG